MNADRQAVNAVLQEPRRHRLSIDDYHRMGEAGLFAPDARVQLIDGEITDMPPIGPSHAGIVDRLTRLLVVTAGERGIVRVQGPVRLFDHSEPEPDLALLRPQDDFYTEAAARADDVLLLIEVADSTLRFDLDVKAPLYARAGIPELWIVDIRGARLLRFASPADGRWCDEDVPGDLRAIRPRRLTDTALDLSPLFRKSASE